MSGLGGGGGYMPMQTTMPQMKAPSYNSTKTSQSSNFRMSGFDAPSESSKDLRGDMNGDECLTIDVDDIVTSAVWQEKSCECVISTVTLSGDAAASPVIVGCLANISLFVAESVLKLQQRSAAEEQAKEMLDASKKTSAPKNKRKKKDSSLACGKGGITLILPSCISQSSLRSAAASVTLSGLSVKKGIKRIVVGSRATPREQAASDSASARRFIYMRCQCQ